MLSAGRDLRTVAFSPDGTLLVSELCATKATVHGAVDLSKYLAFLLHCVYKSALHWVCDSAECSHSGLPAFILEEKVMEIGSWIIGTAILWVVKAIGTVPLAKYLSRSRKPGYTQPTESEALQPEEVVGEGEKQKGEKVEAIPTGSYILADMLVMCIAGFLLGLATGSYFIGISWKGRDWPGMITFIIASAIGSSL